MKLHNVVVVMDLDDTLISEHEYQRSGISAVESTISSLYDVSFHGCIQKAFDEGCKDLWGWACQELGLPESTKLSLKWIYRLHTPNITMTDEMRQALDSLSRSGAHLAVLTDGRSITQRLKLSAIGLNNIPSFISEDYQSTKPEQDRFIAVEKCWPDREYVYIADNPAKDFICPNARGWLTIGARWIHPTIYCSESKFDYRDHPKHWLSRPSQILSTLEAYF